MGTIYAPKDEPIPRTLTILLRRKRSGQRKLDNAYQVGDGRGLKDAETRDTEMDGLGWID